MASIDLSIERPMAWLVRKLHAGGAPSAARALLRVVRYSRRHQPVRGEKSPAANPAANPAQPRGPFTRGQACDLLIFVPRTLEAHLIDEATGHYGYSHVAVDCGEEDNPTGKRVMIESTPLTVVHRSFQDRYGRRPFVRVPLAQAGVDCADFRACVLSRLGEPYDTLEALTWGAVDHPAKQICSDLAAACLSTEIQAEIAHAYRAGDLRRHSVSIHRRPGRPPDIFVSPNGFAQFLGAPPGRSVHARGQLVSGEREQPRAASRHWFPLLVAAAGGIGILIAWRWLHAEAARRHDLPA